MTDAQEPNTLTLAGAKGTKSSNTAPRSVTRLRDLPISPRCFWKADLSSQILQRVLDKTHDGTNDRWLPPNEIDSMALNEIAVTFGSGFFFFLPNRHGWSKQAFDPKSRGPDPSSLRASVPSMVFMRYQWSDSSKARYLQSPHRLRYIACDFQLNPPPSQTPLYCFQIASDPRYPIYKTEHSSFIILRADPLYVGKVADLGAVIGSPTRRRRGPDAEKRLGQPSRVWNKDATNSELDQFKRTSLEELYRTIIDVCHPATTSASMTANELRQLIPRPLNPEIGLPLGEDNQLVQSRSGGRLHRDRPSQDDSTLLVTDDG